MTESLYSGRPLSHGYPELEKQAVASFTGEEVESRVAEIMTCLTRLVDLSKGSRSVTVIGCGPNPQSIKDLIALGYDAKGIEPVAGFAEKAAQALGDPDRIHVGTGESLPLEPESQHVLLLESVLEHVDSPMKALAEAYRVLSPGGVLYVYTTNRLRPSPLGRNDEFNVRFYNWFPAIVKESYVYKHLHYDPSLANYSLRPAVHWFTYAGLCKLGREVGFAQFYSLIDLVDSDAPSIKRRWFRCWLVQHCRYQPWLRSLGLTQFGSSIFMLKRP